MTVYIEEQFGKFDESIATVEEILEYLQDRHPYLDTDLDDDEVDDLDHLDPDHVEGQEVIDQARGLIEMQTILAANVSNAWGIAQMAATVIQASPTLWLPRETMSTVSRAARPSAEERTLLRTHPTGFLVFEESAGVVPDDESTSAEATAPLDALAWWPCPYQLSGRRNPLGVGHADRGNDIVVHAFTRARIDKHVGAVENWASEAWADSTLRPATTFDLPRYGSMWLALTAPRRAFDRDSQAFLESLGQLVARGAIRLQDLVIPADRRRWHRPGYPQLPDLRSVSVLRAA
ncbi:hypothetical protein [Gordonia sp. NB41Y]|uniref:hypothetical protein n=1 Tax=Gordonia sp. NB41Y TaxID=875808 RepID=UPI0002C02B1F|nr:hypothetical protein [Gordonia sp. NB41Y]WLP90798.1 hypothetical protein Q9K23_00380 [Gordonia sp. NB41Y]